MKYQVIVLNWNAINKLAFCLESVKQNSFYSPEVVVIDNASQDESVAWLKLKGYKTLVNDKNKLFTKAYADYLRTDAKDKYFCIMNNDIVVDRNWDKYLIDYLEANENVGIVAPMLTDMTGKQVQNMGGLGDFCSHKGGVPEQWRLPEENFWTTFACVMIRRSAFDKVGGFDEQFLFYCSDSSLCLEMGFEGYKTFNIPESKARHAHGMSTHIAQKQGLPIMQIGREDQLKFNKKYELHGCQIGQNKSPILEAVI